MKAYYIYVRREVNRYAGFYVFTYIWENLCIICT